LEASIFTVPVPQTGTLGRKLQAASVHLSVHCRGQSLDYGEASGRARRPFARRLLNQGLLVLIVAVVTVALSNTR